MQVFLYIINMLDKFKLMLIIKKPKLLHLSNYLNGLVVLKPNIFLYFYNITIAILIGV